MMFRTLESGSLRDKPCHSNTLDWVSPRSQSTRLLLPIRTHLGRAAYHFISPRLSQLLVIYHDSLHSRRTRFDHAKKGAVVGTLLNCDCSVAFEGRPFEATATVHAFITKPDLQDPSADLVRTTSPGNSAIFLVALRERGLQHRNAKTSSP